jgi:hypothetical protein
MGGDKWRQITGVLKELKQEYPDFDVNDYRADINARIYGNEDISDITEDELLLLTDLDEEDLDGEE